VIHHRINSAFEERLMRRALTQTKPKMALDKWRAAREKERQAAARRERGDVIDFAREGEHINPYEPVEPPPPAQFSHVRG
jgi:hypothetical protein